MKPIFLAVLLIQKGKSSMCERLIIPPSLAISVNDFSSQLSFLSLSLLSSAQINTALDFSTPLAVSAAAAAAGTGTTTTVVETVLPHNVCHRITSMYRMTLNEDRVLWTGFSDLSNSTNNSILFVTKYGKNTYLSDVRICLEKLKHSFSFYPTRARSDGYE